MWRRQVSAPAQRNRCSQPMRHAHSPHLRSRMVRGRSVDTTVCKTICFPAISALILKTGLRPRLEKSRVWVPLRDDDPGQIPTIGEVCRPRTPTRWIDPGPNSSESPVSYSGRFGAEPSAAWTSAICGWAWPALRSSSKSSATTCGQGLLPSAKTSSLWAT
jgi:hypothetical protein